jgi:TolB protein
MVDFPGDFTPDGTEFVFKRSADEVAGSLMIVDIAGGEPNPLSADPVEDAGRFSPDGTLVLTSAGGEIVVLNREGDVVHRVAETGAFLFGPDWSPDGRWVAFSRATTGPFADIFVSRPDGTDQRQVTSTPANEITLDWGATGG